MEDAQEGFDEIDEDAERHRQRRRELAPPPACRGSQNHVEQQRRNGTPIAVGIFHVGGVAQDSRERQKESHSHRGRAQAVLSNPTPRQPQSDGIAEDRHQVYRAEGGLKQWVGQVSHRENPLNDPDKRNIQDTNRLRRAGPGLDIAEPRQCWNCGGGRNCRAAVLSPPQVGNHGRKRKGQTGFLHQPRQSRDRPSRLPVTAQIRQKIPCRQGRQSAVQDHAIHGGYRRRHQQEEQSETGGRLEILEVLRAPEDSQEDRKKNQTDVRGVNCARMTQRQGPRQSRDENPPVAEARRVQIAIVALEQKGIVRHVTVLVAVVAGRMGNDERVGGQCGGNRRPLVTCKEQGGPIPAVVVVYGERLPDKSHGESGKRDDETAAGHHVA